MIFGCVRSDTDALFLVASTRQKCEITESCRDRERFSKELLHFQINCSIFATSYEKSCWAHSLILVGLALLFLYRHDTIVLKYTPSILTLVCEITKITLLKWFFFVFLLRLPISLIIFAMCFSIQGLQGEIFVTQLFTNQLNEYGKAKWISECKGGSNPPWLPTVLFV